MWKRDKTTAVFRPGQANTMRRQQRGAALIVGLIMLLLVTLLGIAGMRDTLLQEKMSGNMRDREMALQAAEAALRAGEAELQGAALPTFNNGYGFYTMMDRDIAGKAVSEQVFWKNWNWDNNDSVEYNPNLDGIDTKPRYVVEQMSADMNSQPNPSVGTIGGGTVQAVDLTSEDFVVKQDYRVTAMGWGSTDDASVMVQSTYRRE